MTLFGNDQELAGLGAQLGGAPGDLVDLALAVADLDPVADAERLLDLDRQAGEQVAERVLQREAERPRRRRPTWSAAARAAARCQSP